jgi:hypothetical protein
VRFKQKPFLYPCGFSGGRRAAAHAAPCQLVVDLRQQFAPHGRLTDLIEVVEEEPDGRGPAA